MEAVLARHAWAGALDPGHQGKGPAPATSQPAGVQSWVCLVALSTPQPGGLVMEHRAWGATT